MHLPFEEILTELKDIKQQLNRIASDRNTPRKQLLSDFCREKHITRPTAYAWRDKGLVTFEKIGSRNYVDVDSVKVSKYQRVNP